MKIKDTTEAWESGALGRDERYVEVVEMEYPTIGEEIERLKAESERLRNACSNFEGRFHDACDLNVQIERERDDAIDALSHLAEIFEIWECEGSMDTETEKLHRVVLDALARRGVSDAA